MKALPALAALLVLAACASGPGHNEVVASQGRSTKWRAQITKATFDGNLTVVDLGQHVSIVIASCYAHAQQKLGDHDKLEVSVDGKPPAEAELDIADCSTKHVVATLHAKLADGTKVEAAIDTDLSSAR
jgi:hypothetical protein